MADLDPSIRYGFAQVGAVRLHYAERGEGDRLVLLLHGFPEFWYSWRHQLTGLDSARYRLVAPDLRGYNLSDRPPRVEDYRLGRLTEDVSGLVRHFGAREAAIVGHDWGAGLAWAVAERNPEVVWKVAALQGTADRRMAGELTRRQALRSWYMLFFQLPWIPERSLSAGNFASLDRTFRHPSVRPGSFSDADIARYREALRRPGALTAAIHYYRANIFSLFLGPRRRAPAAGDVGRIRVPALFIYGERDFAIVTETVRDVDRWVDAPYRELRIPDSGHWVQNEAPTEVNAALAEFLAAP